MPFHASQMYARTVTSYLMHLVKEGRIQLDLGDELTRGPLVTHQGEIVHEAVKATLAAAAGALEPRATGRSLQSSHRLRDALKGNSA